MAAKGHLLLHQAVVAPADEWNHPPAPWVVLRLEQGLAYWISPAAPLELAQGDALVVSNRTPGVLRASQINEVTVVYYTVNPDLLGGLLTLAERHLIQARQNQAAGLPLHLPARHSLAVELGRICDTAASVTPLVQRCRLLHLFAAALQPHLGPLPALAANGQAEKRFHELMASLSEPELLRYTPRELAARCGCSPRHFARLFHAHFGCSVREKLTELRLRKARELLLLSQSTVAGVAVATGFRHLGLFNAVFKKHFGETPRRWREQHRQQEGAV
ncbi:MAG: helix-turn-helix transcriptional regulator [Verrucomicrobiae bacterium]|nr:helix-turn-helix transcriptional regulator [Verrucomicrobiae bacterium]